MNDPALLIAVATGATFGLSILSAALLRGWQGWLDLKRMELQQGAGDAAPRRARNEVGDLRERVRKLEAIASGEA